MSQISPSYVTGLEYYINELRNQVSILKVELREICAAIDDPAGDLTLTAVECIKKLKAENECRLTLIHQIHELADHIERAAPSVTDSDMRKQMLEQREYALKVSAKWNMNGNPFSPQHNINELER